MRNIILFLLTVSVFFSACTKDFIDESYTFYRPSYKTKDEVKANIKNNNAEEITNPGKLFIRGNYVFLNDVNKGVHIINYSNPSSPQNVGFINIPGNVDIAVRGNYLYADCYTDLVAIDISDPANVKLSSFIEGVFPHRIYDAGFYSDTSRVIVSWVRVDTVVRRRYSEGGNSGFGRFEDSGVLFSTNSVAQQNKNSGPTNGKGGSLARFALYNNRMYTVSYNDIKIFNTTNTAIPSYVGNANLSEQQDIETIYPYQDKLFIGSQSGMYIYSVSNPDNPKKLATATHIRSCDPVIADGNYAYVTLKGGSKCGGFENQLEVFDVSDITSPNRLKIYPMTGPTGLSKDGDNLLICDDNRGLIILNAANPQSISAVSAVPGIIPYDVIAENGLALVVAKDGIYFIDYKKPASPFVLSKINVSN